MARTALAASSPRAALFPTHLFALPSLRKPPCTRDNLPTSPTGNPEYPNKARLTSGFGNIMPTTTPNVAKLQIQLQRSTLKGSIPPRVNPRWIPTTPPTIRPAGIPAAHQAIASILLDCRSFEPVFGNPKCARTPCSTIAKMTIAISTPYIGESLHADSMTAETVVMSISVRNVN
jgi:hypothetical protein